MFPTAFGLCVANSAKALQVARMAEASGKQERKRRMALLPGLIYFALVFALLLLAELLVGALLFGRGPAEHFALYAEASYALGLLAQIGFGLLPLIQIRMVEKP